MLSRDQARHAADALLEGARSKLERRAAWQTRHLVRIYPALKQVPALERHATLRGARQAANGHWLSKTLLGSLAVTFLLFVGLDYLGRADASQDAGWLAAFLFVATHVTDQLLIRRHLRVQATE